MGGLSIWHWLIVLLVVVLIFGTKRLTSGAKDLGTAVRSSRRRCARTNPARTPPAQDKDAAAPKPQDDDLIAIRRSCADALARPARCSTSAFPNWS